MKVGERRRGLLKPTREKKDFRQEQPAGVSLAANQLFDCDLEPWNTLHTGWFGITDTGGCCFLRVSFSNK